MFRGVISDTHMAVSTRALAYRDRETSLTGVLSWSDTQSGRQPGILLIHGGAGLDEHARDQTRRYPPLRYTVLARDIFGEGLAGAPARVIPGPTPLPHDPPPL